MDGCAALLNSTVPGTNLTWTDVSATVITSIAGKASYLRPNTGGALLPWVYTLLIVVVHFPMVIIRVVRWEIVSICMFQTLGRILS